MALKLLAALLALPALLTPLVAADSHGDCDGKGAAALGIITLGSGQPGSTTIYVDDRSYPFGNGLWIYEESNNEGGLQRGGSSPYVPGDNEICWDDSANGPDTLIF